MRYDPNTMAVRVEKKEIDDPKLKRALGNVAYRIALDIKTEKLTGNSTIDVLKSSK